MGAEKNEFLQIEGIEAGYGELSILRGVTCSLGKGTITAIIGANGAGKSTLLKTVFGIVPARAGRITFDGNDITRLKPSQRLAAGIALVPQGRCNFPFMTVRENLEMAAYTRKDRSVQDDIDQLYQTFDVLLRKDKQMAGNLSGGEQQILEMSMALMMKPRLILLDEPSLGLSPLMLSQIFEDIRRLRDRGTTIFMVEQNAIQALKVADKAIVVELGRVSQTGHGVAMLDDPHVRSAYLGLST